MQYVPRIVLDEIEKELCSKFEKTGLFTSKMMEPDEVKNLAIELLTSEFHYDEKPMSDVKSIRHRVVKRIKGTKKNWLKQVEGSTGQDNPIERELSVLQRFRDNPAFSSKFNELDDDEFKEKRLENLRTWASDPDAPTSAFPFFSEQHPASVKTAIRNDAIWFIAEYIIAEYGDNGDLRKAVENNPEAISQPIWTDKSIYRDETVETIRREDELHTVTLYNFHKDGEELTLQTSLPLNTDDVVESKGLRNHQPDGKDMEIIRFIFRQKDNEFYKTKSITFDLRQLVLEIFKTASVRNYDNIEERLKKLSNIRFEMRIKSSNRKKKEGSMTWAFFDSLLINTDENGRRFVHIVIANSIYEQMINNQTTQIYQREVSRLELNLSKFLIHALQKERLRLNAENSPLTGTYSVYGFFMAHVRLPKGQFVRNMEMIQQALQEFKELGIIIEDYRPNKSLYEFEITFKPLSDMERADYENRLTAPPLPLN